MGGWALTLKTGGTEKGVEGVVKGKGFEFDVGTNGDGGIVGGGGWGG